MYRNVYHNYYVIEFLFLKGTISANKIIWDGRNSSQKIISKKIVSNKKKNLC